MANAYYTCNLLPIELVGRCGYAARWLGNYLQDPAAPARREALSIHPMTCPYVTRLVTAADVLLDGAPEEDCLLVPGGCDAMRRMGDLLAATYPDRVFVLSMPRSSGEGPTETLAEGLAAMESWLRGRLTPPVGADTQAGPGEGVAAAHDPPRLDYPSAPQPGGVFVVAGPLSDDSLLGLIGRLGAEIAGVESCTSPDRWRPLAGVTGAADVTDTAGADGAAMSAESYRGLATQVLSLGMCPRRSTTDRRDHLARRLDETRPSSVIYARQSFCDPGAYDALLASTLAQERGLPFLEIEVGFPFEASGPLRTRVEAFLEAQLLDDDLLDDAFDDDLFEDAPGEDIFDDSADEEA